MKMHDVQVCTFYTRVNGTTGDTEYLRRFQTKQWEMFYEGSWRLLTTELCNTLELERDLYTHPELQAHKEHLPERDDERRS